MKAYSFNLSLYCDGSECPDKNDGPQGRYGCENGRVMEQHNLTGCMKAARKDGWSMGKKDLCPKCNSGKVGL